MAVLLKTASVRVSFIQIMQIRVQTKGKSVCKSRYVGNVSPPSVVRELEVRRGRLWEAYARCGKICEEYAKNFYFCTKTTPRWFC